ncbi:phenylalanine ammonia-lyase [Periconia macrospinosa]|uniref:Phenylalanine ammonia-lyase n=1 Tax=Periconia macrospinosa TaxID=97972 RepID=A0A2V1D9P6_9PLEO|nr:phenylalanine ammonia-lyase [Periconia macrospinosa]
MKESTSFSRLFLSHFENYSRLVEKPQTIVLDGHCLTLADVVAVARHNLPASLSENAIQGIEASAEALQKSISKGEIIYGVNTGFGGSADTRTRKIENLQREIIRGLNYGILEGNLYSTPSALIDRNPGPMQRFTDTLPIDNQSGNHMPESWVRGMALIRLNSLVTGASGVRLSTVETLFKLLQENIMPLVPLRGSISASGDLSPLSYIGSTIQGKPNIMVMAGEKTSRHVSRADVALAAKSIPRIHLGPKEGLAIVNGTAASTSVGALAMHEAMCQATLSQILTAMSVEALLGTNESFDPFFSHVRPHPGQTDTANTIYRLLRGSSLMQRGDGSEKSSLRQDRYSIRTAPQWTGPILEDFTLAHDQVVTELNSVTDNPLIDITGLENRTIHGGNFQAKSITSAMDKVRLGTQSIGKMLFAQCTELINPATNRGLPPNLVFDEPSESYIWKGTDIMIAALVSELGFLANPVGTHVHSAEMGNQSLNSLALVSARYALDALTVLTQLSSAHLVALCQALDLRVMDASFLQQLERDLQHVFLSNLPSSNFQGSETTDGTFHHWKQTWGIFTRRYAQLTTSNSRDRFTTSIAATSAYLLPLLDAKNPSALASLQTWTEAATQWCIDAFRANKDVYFANPDATPYLGVAAGKMYTFVRKELGIPFIRNDSIATPQGEEEGGVGVGNGVGAGRLGMTMGDVVTKVYRSQRCGALYEVVAECLMAVEGENGKM